MFSGGQAYVSLSEAKPLWQLHRAPNEQIQRFFAALRMTRLVTGQRFGPSSLSAPLSHLLREWTLHAVRIVLHAKVFVDLE